MGGASLRSAAALCCGPATSIALAGGSALAPLPPSPGVTAQGSEEEGAAEGACRAHGAHVLSCAVGALSWRLLVCGLQGQTGAQASAQPRAAATRRWVRPSSREGWLLFCPSLPVGIKSREVMRRVRDAARPRRGGQERAHHWSKSNKEPGRAVLAGRRAAKTRHKIMQFSS